MRAATVSVVGGRAMNTNKIHPLSCCGGTRVRFLGKCRSIYGGLGQSLQFPALFQDGRGRMADMSVPLSRICCVAGRRHHRRRDSEFRPTSVRPKDSDETERFPASNYRRRNGSDDRVVITLDMEEWKHRAADAVVVAQRAAQRSVNQVVSMGQTLADETVEAWRELRSSVRVQKDRRVVIALRRSTLDFAGRALVWSVLGVLFLKVFIHAVRENRWGWEEGYSRKVVRDRSMGGREVAVSNGVKLWEGGPSKRAVSVSRGPFNPLDSVESSRSEKTLRSNRDRVGGTGTSKRAPRLPCWWPGTDLPPSTSMETRQRAEDEANRLVQGIMQKRLIGYDYAIGDMVELRKLCKAAGAKVKFDTSNTRDSFYRAAINLVLTACSSSSEQSIPELGSEGGVRFIAGLAANIGLEDERAATMVNAAVAARTRSGFLQARALYLQGKVSESEDELLRLIRLYSSFQPDYNSPEMELVARGLQSHFDQEGKLQIIQLYLKAGGLKTKRVAEEALGLLHSS